MPTTFSLKLNSDNMFFKLSLLAILISLSFLTSGFETVFALNFESADLIASTLTDQGQLDPILKPEGLVNYEPVNPGEGTAIEDRIALNIILYVGRLVSRVLVFLGVITIVFLIIAGSNYILAFGKEERINKGKRGVFWALVGFIVVLFSYTIVQAVIQVILTWNIAQV